MSAEIPSVLEGRVLMLNATYEPLKVISVKRAIVMVMTGIADVVEEGDADVHSPSITMKAPLIIRLREYKKVPRKATLALNRKNVCKRDRNVCAYCGGQGNTIDHIHPRSKGGRHEWMNVVCACYDCNNKKDDKLLSDMGWKLRFEPYIPSGGNWVVVDIRNPHPSWEPYLNN